MKKTMKIVSILMMTMMIVMATSTVFAGTVTIPEVTPSNPPADTSKIVTLASTILGFLQIIAGIAAVVIIAIFGVKYMMGSLEEKADYKKSFIPLIVGLVVVFGASSIGKLIITTFNIF